MSIHPLHKIILDQKATIERLQGVIDERTEALSFMTNAVDPEQSEETADWELTDIRWRCKITNLRAELSGLQAIVDKLLEVGDDLRCYTHDWDWKYGEYWDRELNKAREAAEAALAKEQEETG